MDQKVVLLTPSHGLGGGIERYVDALESAFAELDVEHVRIDLRGHGAAAHARMLGQTRNLLRASTTPVRLVLAHRALLPVASLLGREPAVDGVSVICHGADVWVDRWRPRWLLESRLMRRPGVRVIAVSSFTAGALSAVRPASVLPPGLPLKWFSTLAEASARPRPRRAEVHLLTAFRLDDWQDKGLPQLLAAIAGLERREVRLVVCGSGEPPPRLLRIISDYPFCTLRPGLSDGELARQFADADLFVLATRTRTGRLACGEGFGLVLIEAQLAGTPVIAPAYGGSYATFVDGVTGVAPADETPASLARALGGMLADQERLARMGASAAAWAREAFAPGRYALLVAARLL